MLFRQGCRSLGLLALQLHGPRLLLRILRLDRLQLRGVRRLHTAHPHRILHIHSCARCGCRCLRPHSLLLLLQLLRLLQLLQLLLALR